MNTEQTIEAKPQTPPPSGIKRQFLPRKRPVCFRWIADGALCGLFTVILLIAGANTHCEENSTGQIGDRGAVHHERH